MLLVDNHTADPRQRNAKIRTVAPAKTTGILGDDADAKVRPSNKYIAVLVDGNAFAVPARIAGCNRRVALLVELRHEVAVEVGCENVAFLIRGNGDRIR